MKQYRSEILLAVVAGLLSVSAPSHAFGDQQVQPPAKAPGSASPTARPNQAPNLLDDFEGLTYTDQQKDQIRKIHEQSLSRLNIVANDPKLDASQKSAMLQGYERIEYNQVYEVLTPEQKAEVRKKIAARREQEQHDKQKRQPSSRASRPS